MVLLPNWSVRECSQYGYSWDLKSGPIVEVVLLLRWPFSKALLLYPLAMILHLNVCGELKRMSLHNSELKSGHVISETVL